MDKKILKLLRDKFPQFVLQDISDQRMKTCCSKYINRAISKPDVIYIVFKSPKNAMFLNDIARLSSKNRIDFMIMNKDNMFTGIYNGKDLINGDFLVSISKFLGQGNLCCLCNADDGQNVVCKKCGSGTCRKCCDEILKKSIHAGDCFVCESESFTVEAV